MPVNGSLGDQVGAAYETSKKSKVRRRRVVGTGGSPSSAGGCACWSASNDASIAQGNNLLPGRPVFLERCKIDPMYEAIRRGACCLSLAGSSEDDRPCFPGMVAGNCDRTHRCLACRDSICFWSCLPVCHPPSIARFLPPSTGDCLIFSYFLLWSSKAMTAGSVTRRWR